MDEPNDLSGSGENDVPKEVQLPRLVIEIKENGTISVTGAINDKILAYGLLESARDAIKQYHDMQELKAIKKNGNHGPQGFNFLKRFK